MKDIKGYEGMYAITSCGRVWSYKRKRFLTPDVTRLGYLRYRLCKEGKVERFLAHRLVAEAYIPNPENLPEVSHLDETRDHNYINNLEWVTHKTNSNMPLRRKRLSDSLLNYYAEGSR